MNKHQNWLALFLFFLLFFLRDICMYPIFICSAEIYTDIFYQNIFSNFNSMESKYLFFDLLDHTVTLREKFFISKHPMIFALR